MAELYKRVTASFQYILLKTNEGKHAIEFLEKRGIVHETIEKFSLGFAPADRYWLYHFLGEKGFSAEFLGSSGLFSKRYPQIAFFSNRLIFPIMDKNSQIIAFGGRILEGEGPKYINSSESDLYKKGRTLFALNHALGEIRKTKEVYLAEGYMDVIALHQTGITNAIAPLGTAFTDEQAKLLKRWANKVYLMFDNDEAGQNAAQKAIYCCRRNSLDCLIIDTAPFFKDKKEICKDPGEILQKYGQEALKKAIESCILDVDFMISRSRALKDNSERVVFLFHYLDALDSEVARDNAIGIIADTLRVERRAVWEDYHRNKTSERNTGSLEQTEQPKKTIRAGFELLLMGAVFVNPALWKDFRSGLNLEDLDDSNARELYLILEEWFRGSEAGMAQTGLLERIQDEKLRDFVLRQEALGAFANPAKIAADGLQRIKIKTLEKKRSELIRELRKISQSQGEFSHNNNDQAELLAEKVFIDAELTRLKDLSLINGDKVSNTIGVINE